MSNDRKRWHGVWDGGSFTRSVAGTKFQRRIIGLAHWCPGCGKPHVLRKSEYEFDAMTETVKPACIHPIILDANSGSRRQEYHCVYAITNGRIYYGRECTHDFAGREIALPEWRVTDWHLPAIPGTLTA